MQHLAYTMPHNLRRLADELAALPELAPTTDPAGGPYPTATHTLSSDGATAYLTLPDGIDAPAVIDPVLAAHDPRPDPAGPSFAALEDRERLAIINERAAGDPAFAALAALALRGVSR